MTTTISLWVPTASFVLVAAGRTAVALETSATTTTAATRKRRNTPQGYSLAERSLTELGRQEMANEEVCGPIRDRVGVDAEEHVIGSFDPLHLAGSTD